MRYLRLFGLVGLLLGLMLVSTNCAPPTQPITTEADFTGFITGIQPDLISAESHADKLVAKYTITVTNETLIFRQDGNNLPSAAFSALAEKQWVQIWFSGPVMESWPMQANARQIVIME